MPGRVLGQNMPIHHSISEPAKLPEVKTEAPKTPVKEAKVKNKISFQDYLKSKKAQ